MEAELAAIAAAAPEHDTSEYLASRGEHLNGKLIATLLNATFVEPADSIKFTYEGHGEHTFGPGDCCLQPPGIVHNELECSDDLELLEITSPASYETVALNPPADAAE